MNPSQPVAGLAEALSLRTLAHLVDALDATERTGAGGGPMLVTGGGADGPSATMRVFTSASVPKIVSTVLAVPARGVVTCMIFAFTPAGSALPHFTLDCADRPDGHAFHLDLTPRVELATHVPYMDEVFEPLSPLRASADAVAGLAATGTTRRQYALMSPWMLVHLADASAFRAIEPIVRGYADHWLAVLHRGLSPEVARTVADTDLAKREAVYRRNLFDPEIDPVWGRVRAMIGEDAASAIRSQLETVDP